MSDIKVKCTVYKNNLVIETLRPEEGETEDFFPAGGGRFGCTLKNSGKNLGLSEEAKRWLKDVKPGTDSIGDLDAFWGPVGPEGNEMIFGWFGSVFTIKDRDAIGARNHKLRIIPHVTIPNDTNPEAVEAIDEG